MWTENTKNKNKLIPDLAKHHNFDFQDLDVVDATSVLAISKLDSWLLVGNTFQT